MSADDEKTRVLQRRSAEVAAPVVPAEKIVFHCPNGHRIAVAVATAGKRGKCSLCGIDVTIPRQSGENAAELHKAVPPPPPAAELNKAVPPPPPAAVVSGPEVQFQPPPQPAVDEVPSAEPADENWNFNINAPAEQPAAEGFEPVAWPAADSAAGLAVGASNPTAALVGRLWAERQHGGVIELHLAGGSVILPEWYDANWSRGTHGLFASQAADGSVTLMAVPWETVQKIVVRQLTEVPNDMFT